MLTLFLDESGDHNLLKIDEQFPVFTLAGAVFEDDYYGQQAIPAVTQFKVGVLGRSNLILHTADITRNKNGFEALSDPDRRSRFYSALNDLVQQLEFTVLAASIRKIEHKRLIDEPADPYHSSLEVVLERFFDLLERQDAQGRIIAESRNRIFNDDLKNQFALYRERGTFSVSGDALRARIETMEFRHKRENLAGLQVADLLATPISRFVIGKRTHEDFSIIERKFARDWRGEYLGYGLTILP